MVTRPVADCFNLSHHVLDLNLEGVVLEQEVLLELLMLVANQVIVVRIAPGDSCEDFVVRSQAFNVCGVICAFYLACVYLFHTDCVL